MTQHNKREPIILPDVLELHEMLTRRQNGEDLQNEAGLLELVERDFQEADLSGLDLSYCDFSGSNFSRAKLIGTQFNDNWLSHCLFFGADLSYASLVHVSAIGVNLSGANCQHMKAASAQFIGAQFVGTFLRFAQFNCADLSGACFASIHTDASCTIFDEAVLYDTDLSDIHLEESSFRNARIAWTTKFRGSTFTEQQMGDAIVDEL